MADTKHDIWNDDDGEGELKAQSTRKRRRTGLFLLVLGVVLAVVLVAAYRGGTGFDALRRVFSYGNGGTTKTGAYAYEPSSQNRFAVLGAVSYTHLDVYKRQGEVYTPLEVFPGYAAGLSAGGAPSALHRRSLEELLRASRDLPVEHCGQLGERT